MDPFAEITNPRDPNTLSNYHNFATRHTKATFEVDFKERVLKGGVQLIVESLNEKETKEIVLDTRFVFVFVDLKSGFLMFERLVELMLALVTLISRRLESMFKMYSGMLGSVLSHMAAR